MGKKMFHSGITQADIKGATVAIIPGDPERVVKIANLLDNPTHLATHREYNIYLAYIDNKPIIICSTGIGGPSTSIAVEELAQLGIRKFLRVGTTGAIQPNIMPGDLIVSQASLRLDGASLHFAPLNYPAVADFELTNDVVDAAKELGNMYTIGITASSDTFYPGQERYDTYTGHVAKSLRGSMEEWQKIGILNYEMETATLFTMCATMGLKAACVAGVLVNRTIQEIPDESIMKKAETNAVNTVILAAKKALR